MNSRLKVCLLFCVSFVTLGIFVQFGGTIRQSATRTLFEQGVYFSEEKPKDEPNLEKLQVPYTFPDDNTRRMLNTDYSKIRGPVAGFPFDTNATVVSKTTVEDVITESQILHYQLFNDLIGQYPYVILTDLATHENKGDSAIGVGETLLIHRLNKKVIFYCESAKCGTNQLLAGRQKALSLGRDKVAVLCHGGGNIISYEYHDKIRKTVFTVFHDFKIIVFPQSIWLHSQKMLEAGKLMYASYPNVTLLIRDAQSMKRAREVFPKNNLILAPDMAFQFGSIPRTLNPHYDIIWIKRGDGESAKYSIGKLNITGLSVKIGDWFEWFPSKSIRHSMEKINMASQMGFLYLQRGQVVITDRLHGHIMATLLHMPHVLLDTSDHKLAAYHNTWTRGLEGGTVLTATSPQDAVNKARHLLHKFHDSLPSIVSSMHLRDGSA